MRKVIKLGFSRGIYIFTIGVVGSFLVTLISYLLFAQTFKDLQSIITTNNIFALNLIIIGMTLVSIVASIIVAFQITDRLIKPIVLIYSSIFAFLLTFVAIISISFFTLFYRFSNIFSEGIGTALLNFPTILTYFAVYILPDPVWIFFVIIVVYYAFFVFFVSRFYKEKKRKEIKYNPRF